MWLSDSHCRWTRRRQTQEQKFLPSFTFVAPENEYHTLGDHHFRVYEFSKNLAQFAYYAQMNDTNPIHFHGIYIAAD